MALEDGKKRAEVPKYEEPMLRDQTRRVNLDKPYTQTLEEGALPADVVVIPDTEKMYNKAENINVFDLYEVGSLREGEASLPFVHGVEIAGPKGEVVRFRSMFDDGALVNAIDEAMYRTLKGRLTALAPSGKIFRMVDGRRVPSIGVWRGRVTVKGVHREGVFEIFNSNGTWAMLFGKPLLKTFNAVHNYTEDTIRIPKLEGAEWVILANQYANTHGIAAKLLANLTVDIKQVINVPQSESFQMNQPAKTVKEATAEIIANSCETKEHENDSKHVIVEDTQLEPLTRPGSTNAEQARDTGNDNWSSIWLLDGIAGNSSAHPGVEQPDVARVFEPTLLTRKTDPYNPARIDAILAEVTIGQDLTPAQRKLVRQTVAEHAECFALSMSEVTPVEGAAHRLDIPRDKQF